MRAGAQFRLPQKRQATQRAKRAYQSVRQHRYQKAVKHPARIPSPPERRVPSTSHRRVVPPCGGTRISTPFGPSQRSAPLRCDALALLRSNAPHRSPSLRAAHRLHRFTGRLLPAILLRRCLPSRNTCKLYVDNANMVIDQLSLSTGLPCAGLLCRTRRQRFRTGGPGPMQESHARFARTLRALHAANARRLARGCPGALSQCLHAQQPRLLGYR